MAQQVVVRREVFKYNRRAGIRLISHNNIGLIARRHAAEEARREIVFFLLKHDFNIIDDVFRIILQVVFKALNLAEFIQQQVNARHDHLLGDIAV